ncbi:DNA-binding GntR family transcriptional regulator [Crossiella equi]|uniref:DNA-binding GntR family transcriptional regulator n=1 Tax=Crossiella equi TaxID=130796 RepID=A0ABS5A9E6_9PSEU|nr:GntR family transcriptional regulator [Crossiella equi]MBP2472907.1 DNA-binding GntR family transcriptional regulator [Crossiella equi]
MTHEVHARLREEVLDGTLVPGQRLVEAELAERYGVSRAGVRAALLDLTTEGLLERVPNRGARVRVVSLREAVEITECRMVLEALCAAKAAERLDEQGAAELQELRERMRAAVRDGDPVTYSNLNRLLDQRVRELSGQETAAAVIERLHAQIVRHQFKLALRAGRPQVSLPEHEAIIDAILARDPAAAEEATKAHLRSVLGALQETAG